MNKVIDFDKISSVKKKTDVGAKLSEDIIHAVNIRPVKPYYSQYEYFSAILNPASPNGYLAIHDKLFLETIKDSIYFY